MPKQYVRVGVTGGRDYRDREHVYRVLDGLRDRFPGFGIILVQGECNTGVDLAVRLWCKSRRVPCEGHEPDWSFGKVAGPMRNEVMVKSDLDLLIAFPGGDGTADCASQA